MKAQTQSKRDNSKRIALNELKKIDYNPNILIRLFKSTPVYDKSLYNPRDIDNTLDKIMDITLNVFNHTKEDVLSKSRSNGISKVRQALGYLMSTNTNAIQEVIASKINVDRACVPYYCKVTEKRMKHNIEKEYLSKVREIQTIIYELEIN